MNLNLTRGHILMAAALVALGNLSARAQPTNRANAGDFSAFRIIADRNIFDPNRRPRLAGQSRPRPVVDSFSLAGTMSYEEGRYAVFDGTGQDYRKVLQAGGKIAGHTVGSISHDSVKLTAGTNEIELKVGMQMRRDDDGHWSAGESSGAGSYAVNSRSGSSGNSGNGNRSTRRSGNGSGRTGSRNDVRTGNPPNNRTPAGTPAAPSAPEATIISTAPEPVDPAVPAPAAEAGNLDPNDPVARLMARRLRETGGAGPNENRNDNSSSNNENQP